MANRKMGQARNKGRLVLAIKLLSVAMLVAIAMVTASGALSWAGIVPPWVADTHWVAVAGIVLVVLALWAGFAAAVARRDR